MRLELSSTLGKSVFWTFNRLHYKSCTSRIWNHMWYFSLHQHFKPIVNKNKNTGNYLRYQYIVVLLDTTGNHFIEATNLKKLYSKLFLFCRKTNFEILLRLLKTWKIIMVTTLTRSSHLMMSTTFINNWCTKLIC